MLLVLGIVLFALGLALTIAWHELGHFLTARMFGIRVPQFMIGFGPTVFSRKRGETEYGLPAIPLGGFIRMIGMIPPAPGERIGRSRRSGMFQGMIDDIRAESDREFLPGDEDRQFWTRKPWQRIIVMAAGPFMNLVLALVLFTVILMGFGVPTAQPVIESVQACMKPSSQMVGPKADDCTGFPPTPAAAAGLRSGDRIVSFEGRGYTDWEDMQKAIRAAHGTVTVVVERDGRQLPLHATLAENQVPTFDSTPDNPQYVTASFLGVSPIMPVTRQTPGQVLDEAGTRLTQTVHSIARLPQKVPELFGSVFLGEKRDPYGPVSVVGVSVLGGKVLESQQPVSTQIATFVYLLAAVNLSLCLLNLLPILPLDGGHILPALWEATKKRIARIRGRPDPGPVDLARLMPLAQAFALVIVLYGGLVIVADIINPVQLPN